MLQMSKSYLSIKLMSWVERQIRLDFQSDVNLTIKQLETLITTEVPKLCLDVMNNTSKVLISLRAWKIEARLGIWH